MATGGVCTAVVWVPGAERLSEYWGNICGGICCTAACIVWMAVDVVVVVVKKARVISQDDTRMSVERKGDAAYGPLFVWPGTRHYYGPAACIFHSFPPLFALSYVSNFRVSITPCPPHDTSTTFYFLCHPEATWRLRSSTLFSRVMFIGPLGLPRSRTQPLQRPAATARLAFSSPASPAKHH